MPDNEVYTAPIGPPPGYKPQESFAPPPGPPPSHHDWQTAVPDTSELPPPPSLFSGYDRSPANNATEEQAKAAVAWLRHRPLAPALTLQQPALDALHWGNLALIKPPGMIGTAEPVGMGKWHCKTKNNSPDSCLVSSLPLYAVNSHHGQKKTIYFEVKILSRRPEVSLGLGFIALPYPPFRLPGWERASLGVHGDDGHRYVNDKWGGRDFTKPFKSGETVGIGMAFTPKGKSDEPPRYGQSSSTVDVDVDVFFTRNGKRDGGWDIHEELDQKQDLPITGLEGGHDLWASVGTFEDVEFEVLFSEKDWLYKPEK